jgi:hypothetical protein
MPGAPEAERIELAFMIPQLPIFLSGVRTIASPVARRTWPHHAGGGA